MGFNSPTILYNYEEASSEIMMSYSSEYKFIIDINQMIIEGSQGAGY